MTVDVAVRVFVLSSNLVWFIPSAARLLRYASVWNLTVAMLTAMVFVVDLSPRGWGSPLAVGVHLFQVQYFGVMVVLGWLAPSTASPVTWASALLSVAQLGCVMRAAGRARRDAA